MSFCNWFANLQVARTFDQLKRNWRRSPRRKHTTYSPFGIQAAQVQVLEDRRLLSALTVTTAADSGAGSLRAEIAAANNGDTINFAASLKGQTITLTSGELLINKGLSIQGPGAAQLTISGGNHSRVFDVTSSQPVVLAGLTISNGNAIGGTAPAGDGGGIYNQGVLTLNQCSVVSDSATLGGGIYNRGTLTASGCTVANNVAGHGGGFDVAAGQATLINCTIAKNRAVFVASNASGVGGGLFVAVSHGGSLHVSLTNCTVASNSAYHGGGGIEMLPPVGFRAPTVALVNTIVAGNTSFDFQLAIYSETVLGADIYGSVALADHDLIGYYNGSNVVAGVNGNIVGGYGGVGVINAGLGRLQNNGGPTMTMALLAGSPAIGHGGGPYPVPATDQRGVTRVDEAGELTDIGAYEL